MEDNFSQITLASENWPDYPNFDRLDINNLFEAMSQSQSQLTGSVKKCGPYFKSLVLTKMLNELSFGGYSAAYSTNWVFPFSWRKDYFNQKMIRLVKKINGEMVIPVEQKAMHSEADIVLFIKHSTKTRLSLDFSYEYLEMDLPCTLIIEASVPGSEATIKKKIGQLLRDLIALKAHRPKEIPIDNITDDTWKIKDLKNSLKNIGLLIIANGVYPSVPISSFMKVVEQLMILRMDVCQRLGVKLLHILHLHSHRLDKEREDKIELLIRHVVRENSDRLNLQNFSSFDIVKQEELIQKIRHLVHSSKYDVLENECENDRDVENEQNLQELPIVAELINRARNTVDPLALEPNAELQQANEAVLIDQLAQTIAASTNTRHWWSSRKMKRLRRLGRAFRPLRHPVSRKLLRRSRTPTRNEEQSLNDIHPGPENPEEAIGLMEPETPTANTEFDKNNDVENERIHESPSEEKDSSETDKGLNIRNDDDNSDESAQNKNETELRRRTQSKSSMKQKGSSPGKKRKEK